MKKSFLLISLFIPVISVLLFISPKNLNAATKSVCIDPGHGGSDIGTSNNEILEKKLNLEVANRLAALLTSNDYTVYQTRIDDSTLSNNYRYTFCNNRGASILVSIHHNGSKDSSLDYSLGLYMKKVDVDLARSIVNAVSAGLDTDNHGISRFASGVLLKAKMPAAMSEGFFLTNTEEYNLLHSATIDRRQEEAQVLYNGIVNYFSSH
ncbi:hypothetical protein A3F00_05220 [Candidatus Daviesbacteria bacterium RIFCSPHIGHO2_12_FULL_37_11]|uniref:MurNAc-LAA domain-containing protein n=1 Tax=Candidatus Daviesbacteria bacterium RIFCSPHIGHO2_12_FULL_37_11 TaxID=1797777 RepID=A0A1F5KA48_9BACT|nr:MAG: hypothetical protein A2111_01860 [Candidatus Daviesbacteria bacterium GWA1_38_6]OGE17363.1 MAG: hypothetical protein A2769_00780 [Candidatus Daviesbacteria bacterium RIFCSPHIGHO2_01_FULL_37_27]OGE37779.1 MAG: hypothetical protein A3F00_05220 [Candidatus Daviesbacteria bacterium RIFCSPHIGHO2_12_FULL_37_11]